MKSYGRAPTFLLATGYEQVRSVVAALAGDRAAADTVQLELPETGVCSSRQPAPAVTSPHRPLPKRTEAGCCAAPEPVLVGFPPAWPTAAPAATEHHPSVTPHKRNMAP